MSINGHLELRRSKDKELSPGFLQETALVPERQAEEGRDALHPLDGHEEDPCSSLADCLGIVEVSAEDFMGVLEEQREGSESECENGLGCSSALVGKHDE